MVKCWPLNWQQNAICICIGLGELPWGIIVKLIPLGWFFNISLEDKDDGDDADKKKKYLSTSIKKRNV